MKNRRKLIAALGVAFTFPRAPFAQQKSKVWRVGYLYQGSRQSMLDAGRYQQLQEGMRTLGYAEGKNFVIESRFADGNLERLPALAAELVELKVDALVTQGSPATHAAQKTTTTVPIVFVGVGNPVASGFVKSLSHPGGNITGLSNISGDLGPKHLEMLLSIAPKVSRMAVLLNPENRGNARYLKSVQAATARTNVTAILPFEARNVHEIESAFSKMAQEKIEAVIVGPDNLFTQQGRQIADLAAKHRLPAIALNGTYPTVGGLISYGQNIAENNRRVATYLDKIFKGSKPSDLPVEQPMRFELVINANAATTLGLIIPHSLRIMADKVIE